MQIMLLMGAKIRNKQEGEGKQALTFDKSIRETVGI